MLIIKKLISKKKYDLLFLINVRFVVNGFLLILNICS